MSWKYYTLLHLADITQATKDNKQKDFFTIPTWPGWIRVGLVVNHQLNNTSLSQTHTCPTHTIALMLGVTGPSTMAISSIPLTFMTPQTPNCYILSRHLGLHCESAALWPRASHSPLESSCMDLSSFKNKNHLLQHSTTAYIFILLPNLTS